MTKYVGCIDIHNGQVKQIVGSTLTDDKESNGDVSTNFVSSKPPSFYAELYKQYNVQGTHVIKLGPGNDEAAINALQAWPGKMQIGGGINISNGKKWIELGASKIIVTSWLFPDQVDLNWERLRCLSEDVGKDKLVVDISCKTVGNGWRVAINKWQTVTGCELNSNLLIQLSEFCDEILVHAADVEGLCNGIDEELVKSLGEWGETCNLKIVYAGGAKSLDDLELVKKLSRDRVDLTYGSSVDIFGGYIKFIDLVEWNNK